jgi:hypothetical protein
MYFDIKNTLKSNYNHTPRHKHSIYIYIPSTFFFNIPIIINL